MEFRLRKILKEHLEKCGGSLTKLANKINEANEGKDEIERRRLGRIIDGNPVALSFDDFLILDRYLVKFNQGLAEYPILERKGGILKAMAQQEKIVFFLGTKLEDYRDNISRWDVRALAKIQNAVQKIKPDIKFEIRFTPCDVELQDEARNAYSNLLKERNITVCSIGSPRANFISELLCATMVDLPDKAFSYPKERTKNIPFYFIRGEVEGTQKKEKPSCFSFEFSRLAHGEKSALEKANAWAIQVGETKYQGRFPRGKKAEDKHDEEIQSLEDYSVLVAQRRVDINQMWVCLNGLSGTGTYGSAVVLAENNSEVQVPYPTQGVLLLVTETSVRWTGTGIGDRRIESTSASVEGPKIWSSEQTQE